MEPDLLSGVLEERSHLARVAEARELMTLLA